MKNFISKACLTTACLFITSLSAHALSLQGNLNFAAKRVPSYVNKIPTQQVIELLGIGHLLNRDTHSLSGGERQRVAIARALVTKPSLILADEPTGNLDYDNAQSVFGLLSELQSTMKTALLMVTHDRSLAALADRQLLLRNGHWEDY